MTIEVPYAMHVMIGVVPRGDIANVMAPNEPIFRVIRYYWVSKWRSKIEIFDVEQRYVPRG